MWYWYWTSGCVPLYLSEVAPCNDRICVYKTFQSATIFGIYTAGVVNYALKLTPSTWRISLGVVIFPATILTLGGMFLPDSPQSLIERGRPDEGRKALEKIRGTSDVDSEYKTLVEARRVADTVKHPWRNLFELRNRPQLVLAMLIPFFQITTGINLILFYAPLFFFGIGDYLSLWLAMLFGSFLQLSFIVSQTVSQINQNRTKRRFFYPQGLELFIFMMGMGIILQTKLQPDGFLDKGWTDAMLLLMLCFVLGFGRVLGSIWGWTLGGTVTSEIFALETGSAGQSMVVYVSFFFTFLMSQALPTMVCHFQYGTFYLFGTLIVMMIIFGQFFVPEIENDHVEDWPTLWKSHWFWKRYVPQEPSKGKEIVNAV